MKRAIFSRLTGFVLAALCVFLVSCSGPAAEKQSTSIYAMSTLVTQDAYGENAEPAMEQANEALQAFEKRLSLFEGESDIARLNGAAGEDWVTVEPQTADLLAKSVALSSESEDAFAVTIAPLTLAWGITGDSPRVVSDGEIDRLLPLVDDGKLEVEQDRARLLGRGMGVDLGGIAKGAACALVEEIYAQNNVESALLNIGGNVYARGEKPGGEPWVVGFRDPSSEVEGYIASLPLRDEVIAVSGGYERYFEENGERYIHILDPRTGKPATSDIVSVGVVNEDGAVADFYSTTLFVQGLDGAMRFMEEGGRAIVLDGANNLYVSESLRQGFQLHEEDAERYTLVFVGEENE